PWPPDRDSCAADVLGPLGRAKRPSAGERGRHGIVSGNHNTAQLPPSDRPAGLRDKNPALARSFRFRIPQPPAPRGRRDRACSQQLTDTGPTRVGPFSFWGIYLSFRGARSAQLNERTRNPEIAARDSGFALPRAPE